MKSFVAIIIGGLVALVIGCAAKRSKSVEAPTTTTTGENRTPSAAGAEPGAPMAPSTRSEIDRLDQAISDEMQRLELARPVPPPLTCTTDCAQQMSGAAQVATAPAPPACKPAGTQQCTDSCKLKSSICESAGRICRIASELGGNDAYANDKCSSGSASCEAAKQRCCSCM